jgi:hypothetical protein
VAISAEVTTLFGLSAAAVVSYACQAKSKNHRVVQSVLTSILVVAAIVYQFQPKLFSLKQEKVDAPIHSVNPQTTTTPPATIAQTPPVKVKAPKKQPITQMTFGNQSPIISDTAHDVQITYNSSSADIAQKQLGDKK